MPVVVSLNLKPQTPGERGLPKEPVESAAFGYPGLAGDYNVYRQAKADGDADQAVLLLTTDILEALRAEGWPVEAGHIGENVTVKGLSNGDLRPGVRLRLGEETEVEISKAAEPCANLERLPYVGARRRSEFIRTLLGRRGWYARVLREGTVRVGDPVTTHKALSVS